MKSKYLNLIIKRANIKKDIAIRKKSFLHKGFRAVKALIKNKWPMAKDKAPRINELEIGRIMATSPNKPKKSPIIIGKEYSILAEEFLKPKYPHKRKHKLVRNLKIGYSEDEICSKYVVGIKNI